MATSTARKRRRPRRALDTALNVLFVAWVLHIAVTGNLVPEALVRLLRDQPPVAAHVDPSPATEPGAIQNVDET